MKKIFLPLIILSLVFLASCEQKTETTPVKYTDIVDPWIGTGGHGHVFLGASVPWGMVQLGPTSITTGWDWVSGYHVSDSSVIGFSHTHLSGTGIGDLLDVTVMPVVGEVTPGRGTHEEPESGQWSYSIRSQEHVRPGYYTTQLERYGIGVELTATKRVGMHKYHFPEGADRPAVIVDLVNGGNWDAPTEGHLTWVNEQRVQGYRYSTGWAKDQKVYFAMEFSQPIEKVLLQADGVGLEVEATAKELFGRIEFAELTEPLLVKVALSPVSEQNAWKNMQAELPHWDFEQVRNDADQAWEEELSKIKIKSDSEETMRIFYTSLFHTLINPSEYSDVDGSYRGSDFEVHQDDSFMNHTTLSLWDTYRAFHPLMTIIHPERMVDIVETFLRIYEEGGELPIWHLMSNETYTMVGSPGVPVMADAFLKGFVPEKDTERAYTAMKESLMKPARGQEYRMEYGYIPYDKMLESVAYDLEFALADWSVAQVAKELGKEEDYLYFTKRSQSFHHLFDAETGFMRGKSVAGEFNPNFNPFFSSHREDDYCEGNAWQYTFLVPHDLQGLVECFGGEEQLLEKLDALFVQPSEVEGDNTSPDISGMIGQYAHGNEPGHHTIYLYSMLGHQEKAAPLLRHVMTKLYHDEPNGLSGNEDAGQMSAWYILSALGFYQVEPAGGRYFFGTPLVDEAVLNVRDGEFTIKVNNNSSENIYIQSLKLNGEPYTKRWIDFEEIARGGTLEIAMGSTPHSW